MCMSMTVQKKSYSISICEGGHATLSLGRVAVYLEIEELKSLIQAAGDVLAEWEDRHVEPVFVGRESQIH